MMAALFFLANIAVSAGTWLAIREFRRMLAAKADADDSSDQHIKLNGWCRRLSSEITKVQHRQAAQDAALDAANAKYRRLAERLVARGIDETNFDYERRIDAELGIK